MGLGALNYMCYIVSLCYHRSITLWMPVTLKRVVSFENDLVYGSNSILFPFYIIIKASTKAFLCRKHQSKINYIRMYRVDVITGHIWLSLF